MIKRLLLSLGVFFATAPFAFAQRGGLDNVNTILEAVVDVLEMASIAGATIAILWGGYRVLFGGQTFREAAPVLIGGIVLGTAGPIARMLLGG